MSRIIKLNELSRQLVTSWQKELLDIRSNIDRVFNELYNSKLAVLAKELGIDISKQEWIFDGDKMAFIEKAEKVQEAKRGRPKKVTEEEPELPFDPEPLDK